MALFEALFNVGSNTALESYTPDSGAGFTLVQGTAGSATVVSSGNALVCTEQAGAEPIYHSDDPGSANNYIEIIPLSLESGVRASYICTRFVDEDNFIAMKVHGNAALGFRLLKFVAGVETILIQMQGVIGNTYRMECDGTDVKLFENGIQQGSTQTITEFETETSQGFLIGNNTNQLWLDEYRTNALSSGISVTGTAVPTQTEADIVTGGKTIILTLAGDTFVTGTSSLDGIAGGSDSDKTGANKWDSLIKTALDNTDVVLSVGDTVATITLPAFATYDTAETETITWTIPAASLTTGTSDIIATPTHTVTPIAGGDLLLTNRSIANFQGMRQ